MAENENHESVNPNVKIQPKPLWKKILGVFFHERLDNVGQSVVDNIIVPTLMNMVVDMVQSGIELLVYGKTNGPKQHIRGSGTKVDYNSISTKSQTPVIAPRSSGKSVYDIMNIVVTDYGKGQLYLDRILEIVTRYPEITVHAFYDACEVTDTNANDLNYGWKSADLANINLVRGSRNGEWVFINVPMPYQLK